MNFWIAKLGPQGFADVDISEVSDCLSDHPAFSKSNLFQYRATNIHYLSLSEQSERTSKSYHYCNDHGSLTAYSGLLIGSGAAGPDYRNAKNICHESDTLEDIPQRITGQYSIINALDNHFECIVDCLGFHKVFYHRERDGAVYVSNYPRFIKLFKPESRNIEFYATWLSVGETYGSTSDEQGLYSLPFYGHLVWSDTGGLDIRQYGSIRNLIEPEQSGEDLIKKTANEFRGAAEYLTSFHESVIPLSGGFDSRLILDSFTGLDKSTIECYTYPDHPNDLIIAKLLAKNRGYRHQVLNPGVIPDFESMHSYAVRSSPFITYGTVFDYLFEQNLDIIFSNPEKVKVSGNGGGGGSGFGLKKFAYLKGSSGLGLIDLLTDHSVNDEIITPDASQVIRNRLKDYFRQTYLAYIGNKDAYRKIGSSLFLLERFGRYQSYKMLFSNKHTSDSYLPYGSENFIKTVFSVPEKELRASAGNSIHHQVSRMLTNGAVTPLRFASARHWDASIFRRLKYRIQQNLPEIMSPGNDKFSASVRKQFFLNNRNHYSEILNSTKSSDLWLWIDRDLMLTWINSTQELNNKQIKILSRVVPLVKSGI